ncbi:MAG: site-2 protease family protein [Planctomycetes bacterium]|nr:site-2 protease family protein [Planctomycetota bacterium]
MIFGLILYVVLLVSLVVHEAAHALFALWGGDRTAYVGGQVSLNPLPHIRREPFGTVILPVGMLLLSGGTSCIGYAHIPVDPVWAYRHPRKAALMSAAGPLSNFMLVAIAALVAKVLIEMDWITTARTASVLDVLVPVDGAREGPLKAACMILMAFMYINLLLGMLNLIPVPPLDGSGVVGGLFPRSAGRFFDTMRSQPMFGLIAILAVFYLMNSYGFQAVAFAFNHIIFPLFR